MDNKKQELLARLKKGLRVVHPRKYEYTLFYQCSLLWEMACKLEDCTFDLVKVGNKLFIEINYNLRDRHTCRHGFNTLEEFEKWLDDPLFYRFDRQGKAVLDIADTATS
jgi:hypothetical protein